MPLLTLKELVTDFLHFHCTVLIFVEVNFIFVDLVLRVSFVTLQSQLFIEFTHVVSKIKTFLIVTEARERLNLITLQGITCVVIKVDEEPTFDAVHFDFSDGSFKVFDVNK